MTYGMFMLVLVVGVFCEQDNTVEKRGQECVDTSPPTNPYTCAQYVAYSQDWCNKVYLQTHCKKTCNLPCPEQHPTAAPTEAPTKAPTKAPAPKPKPEPEPVNPCFQNKVVGLCKAAQPKVYFNRRTKKCEKFTYGGCGGNDNNFPTFDACKKQCGKHYAPAPQPKAPVYVTEPFKGKGCKDNNNLRNICDGTAKDCLAKGKEKCNKSKKCQGVMHNANAKSKSVKICLSRTMVDGMYGGVFTTAMKKQNQDAEEEQMALEDAKQHSTYHLRFNVHFN